MDTEGSLESMAAQLLDVVALPLAPTPTHQLVHGLSDHAFLKHRTAFAAHHDGASTTPKDTRETGAKDKWEEEEEEEECHDVLFGPVGGGGVEDGGSNTGNARVWHF